METENGVLSHALHIFYRDQTFRVIALDVPQIFYCMVDDRYGIITSEQMPHVRFEEVMDTQGLGFVDRYRSSEDIRRGALRLLASKGMFLLKCRIGHKFIGMVDWREELQDMVNIANQVDAGIDYEESYKYLEDLTEGMSFEKLKDKSILPVEKMSQSPEDYRKEAKKIADKDAAAAEKDK